MGELSLSALEARLRRLEERDVQIRARAAYATAAIATLAITIDTAFDPQQNRTGSTIKVVADGTRTLLEKMGLSEAAFGRALEHVSDLENFSHPSTEADPPPRSDD